MQTGQSERQVTCTASCKGGDVSAHDVATNLECESLFSRLRLLHNKQHRVIWLFGWDGSGRTSVDEGDAAKPPRFNIESHPCSISPELFKSAHGHAPHLR